MIETDFSVEPASWLVDQAGLKEVRTRVFVHEQKFPEEEEWDALDEHSHHVLAFDAQRQPIGCGRLTPEHMIGRMAVLSEWRGRGVGEALLRTLLEQAAELGYPLISLRAQLTAVGFYERAGFAVEGEPFDELGVQHCMMRKRVERPARAPQRPLPPPVEAQPLIADSLTTAQQCVDRVAEGAVHKLWIYSRDLDRALFDREPFLDYIKRIALSGRGAEVRVLVHDPTEGAREGHRLLHLELRLPSFVLLRTPVLEEDKQYPSAFILNDQGGFLFRVLGSRYEGEGSTHAPGRTRQLQTYFEQVWERSLQDPELRRMSI